MPEVRETFNLEGVPRVPPLAVKEHQDRGEDVLILDVRRHPENVHIKGSVRYEPEDLIKADRIVLPVPKDRMIVAYCT
jgi:rhodanese-related sulfurtransferase